MDSLALAVFSTSVLWLVYTYLGYPIVLWLVGLARRVKPARREDVFPSVSVLISARNEERDIGWKVTETLAWEYPGVLQVLVASDASDDRTDEVVRSVRDPRLRLVRMERRGGKARALNRLAELASGELLFFTDANAHIGPQSLARMVRHFADSGTGCVTGHSYSDAAAAENGTSIYWGHELLVKSLESRLGAVLACDGAIFCMRRSLFRPLSPELANDLELPLLVFDAGYKVVLEPRASVSEKDTISPRQEFSRRRRICGQGALTMVRLRRVLLGARGMQFLSSKVLRWFTAVPLAMLLIASAALMHRPVFAVFFAAQALLYGAGLAGGLQFARTGKTLRPLTMPLYVGISAVGALAGVVDALRGRRFDIWESPALTRGFRPSGGEDESPARRSPEMERIS